MKRRFSPFLTFLSFLLAVYGRILPVNVHIAYPTFMNEPSISFIQFCVACTDPEEAGSLVRALNSHHGPQRYDLVGEVRMAVPNTAHDVLINEDEIRGKVAVVLRGGVPMIEKVKRVQEAGAVAVIIIDDGQCDAEYLDCGYRVGGKESTQHSSRSARVSARGGGSAEQGRRGGGRKSSTFVSRRQPSRRQQSQSLDINADGSTDGTNAFESGDHVATYSSSFHSNTHAIGGFGALDSYHMWREVTIPAMLLSSDQAQRLVSTMDVVTLNLPGGLGTQIVSRHA